VCFLVLLFAKAGFFRTQSGMICFASPIGAFFPTSWWRRTCTQIFSAHRRPGRGCAAPRETHFIEKHEHNDKIKPQFSINTDLLEKSSTKHPSVTSSGKCLEHFPKVGLFFACSQKPGEDDIYPPAAEELSGDPPSHHLCVFSWEKEISWR